MSNSIPFAEGSGVSGAVKSKCNLDTELSEQIVAAESDMFRMLGRTKVLGGTESYGRKVLYLQFTEVLSRSSLDVGTRRIQVQGEIKEDGEAIASFIASRRTLSFGTALDWTSTCRILGHILNALVRDIITWLENPTMDAKLGDAR